MSRGFLFSLIISLAYSGSSQGGCLPDTLVLLAQKLSGLERADEPFRKYYEEGDAQGWKKVVEDLVSKTGGKASLGGNSANTHLVTYPDGSTFITKEFPSAELRDQAKILNQLERWNAMGIGPEILGVSLVPGTKRSEKQLYLVMEDLGANKNQVGKKIVSGTGKEVALLKRESEGAKKWLADRMLTLLDLHADPHPMNVVFRVTKRDWRSPLPKAGTFYQEGDKVYQAFLIDPSGAEGNPNAPLFNTEIAETPGPFLQYNRKWKRDFFKKEMGF